ncbi:MAG: hypothetical protein ABIH82_01785 [Candidatus Woesearchaeota archaeon]
MKNIFKILETGNFYFPIKDKGKEFIVEETIDVVLDKKDKEIIDFCLKHQNMLDFGILSRSIWKAIQELNLKYYKNRWIVPIRLDGFGKEYKCTIDVLKRVKSKDKKNEK